MAWSTEEDNIAATATHKCQAGTWEGGSSGRRSEQHGPAQPGALVKPGWADSGGPLSHGSVWPTASCISKMADLTTPCQGAPCSIRFKHSLAPLVPKRLGSSGLVIPGTRAPMWVPTHLCSPGHRHRQEPQRQVAVRSNHRETSFSQAQVSGSPSTDTYLKFFPHCSDHSLLHS